MIETAVVTGASRGIGNGVARKLTERGLRVIAVSRKPAEGIESICGDLSRMAEVRRIAAEVRQAVPQVSLLVNNAGVFERERVLTDEGIELTFAVNQMAPFLLTRELAPARVVNVGSEVHRRARLDLTDLQSAENYRGITAYANSKLAMILFTRELVRRGTPAIALHPGVVETGTFQSALQDMPWFLRMLMPLMRPFLTSESKAAEGIARLAADPEFERGAGCYFTGGHVREPAADAQSDATALVWWEALSHLSAPA
ncbi:MAG: SDR family NAD(P)-dependent oxidoreductase [Planctomycetota bacterium]